MEEFIVLFGHKSFKKILHKNKAVDNADEEMLNKGGWKCQLHSETPWRLDQKKCLFKKKKNFSHNLKHFSSKFIIKLEKIISLNAG